MGSVLQGYINKLKGDKAFRNRVAVATLFLAVLVGMLVTWELHETGQALTVSSVPVATATTKLFSASEDEEELPEGYSYYSYIDASGTELGFWLYLHKDSENDTAWSNVEWEGSTANVTTTIKDVIYYVENGTTYYLVPISYLEENLDYIFSSEDTCIYYSPDANYSTSNITQASFESITFSDDTVQWYVKVIDTGEYGGAARVNLFYYSSESTYSSVDSFQLWIRTYNPYGTTASDTLTLYYTDEDGTTSAVTTTEYSITDAIKYVAGGQTYYLIPVGYLTGTLSKNDSTAKYVFDEENLDTSRLSYIPNASNSGIANATGEPFYHAITAEDGTVTWYLAIQDTTGESTPRTNLYYSYSRFVFTLSNTTASVANTNYGLAANAARFFTYITSSLIEDNCVEVTLPCDEDLRSGAYFYTTELDCTLKTLIDENTNYDYKLVGWYNIETCEYYDVSEGQCTALIDVSKTNVFYADWVAGNYDFDVGDSGTLLGTVVDTSSFCHITLFDYNELFNLNSFVTYDATTDSYSTRRTQNALNGETWTEQSYSIASGKTLLGSELYTAGSFCYAQADGTAISSFVFYDTNNGSGGTILCVNNRNCWNLWTGNGSYGYGTSGQNTPITSKTYWDVETKEDSVLLDTLFDTSESAVGVHYVGTGNYLFSYNETTREYTYTSKDNTAIYNQTEGRFYVYDMKQQLGSDDGSFLPYNSYDDTGYKASNSNNTSKEVVNYWFGMCMEVSFYLPNDTDSNDENANQIVYTGENGETISDDMIFTFSGDDDVWVFIDDVLVLDIGGAHSEAVGTINFATGEVWLNPVGTEYEDQAKRLDDIVLSNGTHTLTVYYLERGAGASNLTLSFNMLPAWSYTSDSTTQIKATKDWQLVDDVARPTSIEIGLYEQITITSENLYHDTEKGLYYYVMNGIKYEIGIDGFARDGTEILAYYCRDGDSGDPNKLYRLIDTQILSTENAWTYTWYLLDEEKNYIVLEYPYSGYETSYATITFTLDDYWQVVGKDEILDLMLTAEDGESYQVIFTDATEVSSGESDNVGRYFGQVLYHDLSVGTKWLFSDFVEESIYGLTRSDESDSDIIWYIQKTGNKASDSDSGVAYYLYTFYIYYIDSDGTTQYLYIDTVDGEKTITLSTENKTEFFYNSLGELKTQQASGSKIVFEDNVFILVTLASMTTDENNVKIYMQVETEYEGVAYTITNTSSTAISLVKVDSKDTTTVLLGAEFQLYFDYTYSDGSVVRYYYNTANGTWSSTEQTIVLMDGTIDIVGLYWGYTYTLIETLAPSGYYAVDSAMEFAVDESGNITYENTNAYLLVDTSTFTLTILNLATATLPNAGGSGTSKILFCGSAVMISALVLKKNRRKRRI